MQTRIAFKTLMDNRPELDIAIELPIGFNALPVSAQRHEVEVALTRANETAQRILARRQVA